MSDCGIIAISATKPISKDLFKGIVFLQHRGQEHAGICTYSEKGLHMHKDQGLVLEVFKNFDFNKLPGNIGIGHLRYPTAGAIKGAEGAQPMISRLLPSLALAHNGNLPNYIQKKKDFAKKGIELKSSCDVEVLLESLAQNLIELGYKSNEFDPEIIYNAVGKTMDDFENGSFSVVGILDGKIISFRDKRGIKPLIVGQRFTKDDGLVEYGIASESVGLTQIGFTKHHIRNFEAGFCYIIDGPELLQRRLRSAEKLAHCIFENAYFSNPASWIDGGSVSKRREQIGVKLADEFYNKFPNVIPDVVAPVPDTARTAALSFSERLSTLYMHCIPFKEVIIRNRYMGLRTFIEANQKWRELLVTLKNMYDVKNIPETLVLVDDSIVRATTMKGIISELKEIGAKKIYLAICFPEIVSPCYYGIDFQSKKELIAANMNTDEIAKEIGVDGLIFTSIAGYLDSIRIPEKHACLGCTTGKYPTNIPKDQRTSCETDASQRK